MTCMKRETPNDFDIMEWNTERQFTTMVCRQSGTRRKGQVSNHIISVFTILLLITSFGLPILASDVSEEESVASIDYFEYVMAMNIDCIDGHADTPLEGLYCNATFDSYICWPPTPAGDSVTLDCPEILDTQHLHKISKTCLESGDWSVMSLDDLYHECTKYSVLSTKLSVSCGYISLVACIIAFLIFALFRTLWCTRNYIHWHLITAYVCKYFVLCAVFTLHFFNVQTPTWFNDSIQIIVTYLEMTTFFWMFVEGLYLHTVVALTFRVDVNRIKFYWYCVVGWGIPVICCVILVIVKIVSDNENVEDIAVSVLVVIPIATVLVLNSIFLLNIVRILMSKLRQSSQDTQLKHYRRTARATLVLVILLGVSYVFPIVIFNLIKNLPHFLFVSLYMLNTLIGYLQGFLVALIYVFLNSEVKSVTSRKFKRTFGFNCCQRGTSPARNCSTTCTRWDDNTNVVTTVQPPGNDQLSYGGSPVSNNNLLDGMSGHTLENGKLMANTTLGNSYEMSLTSGDNSPSPGNGVTKEETSRLLAGNITVDANGRTVVHDTEENTKEHHTNGTDV